MARKSIEDIMNEIEDFLNGCKPTTFSANKVIVPRDQFDELFADLKMKIPMEIDRCKKIMRNKDAILMDANKAADGIIAQAKEQASQMVAETEIMNQANQRAYETVEMARVQANEILAQAVADANEIRLGSMRYTNDVMLGIRDYVQSTLDVERLNYEHLLERLQTDCLQANANLEEIQSQIIEFTGDPNSVTRAPMLRAAEEEKKETPKPRQNMVQKVKQAVSRKEEKEAPKPSVEIPSFIEQVDKPAPVQAMTAATKEEAAPDGRQELKKKATGNDVSVVQGEANTTAVNPAQDKAAASASTESKKETKPVSVSASQDKAAIDIAAARTGSKEGTAAKNTQAAPGEKKIIKRVVKKRNPVIHTPQTAQETVARTVEAAKKVDKSGVVLNGDGNREVPAMEGRVKRGPRVGRGMVEGQSEGSGPVE